jgi:hypothetical protein
LPRPRVIKQNPNAMQFEVDDGKDAGAVVCALLTDPLLMPGNLTGVWSRCQTAVQHRPHIPPGIPLVCVACYLKEYDEENDTVKVTPATLRDLFNHQRRN